jgi:hypothetical protein
MCGMPVGPIHLYMEYCNGGKGPNDLCWVTTNDGI